MNCSPARAPRRTRGYTAGTFSFNSGTGRCPTCSGNGFEHVEMQFLSDVYLRCPDCDGKRYRSETLEIRREGADGTRRNIAQVLDMTVTEALAFFKDKSAVAARLQPLVDVGLEYVKLGQPVPTLSGGEAQRLKLAGHLAEAAVDDTPSIRGKLFLFDEPTTGLHFDDVAKLLRAFRKLLKIGHSLLVIEHNLDVMRAADWLIDLGPEGGDGGGQLWSPAHPRRWKRIRPRTPARHCASIWWCRAPSLVVRRARFAMLLAALRGELRDCRTAHQLHRHPQRART